VFDIGFRYDKGQVQINEFYDLLLYQHLIQRGRSEEDAQFFATRSRSVQRNFSQGSFQFQAVFDPNEKWLGSVNLGSVFRFPTAIELAANGIHHGSFRHEVGDASLNPERGWQLEFDFQSKFKKATFQLTPYAYFFENYIFLRPSMEFSPLPHGGQIFVFSQSRALLAGIEFSTFVNVTPRLQTYLSAEYIFNQQLNAQNKGGFSLPFSP
ncbi:TonB-dependent receptor, partial [Arthrospira platensis SPKY1]|nr:TonB-dependent receptor [Arthrospira platensis SPKY1]